MKRVAVEDLDVVLNRAVAWWEALRRLGFRAEDIFLALYGDERCVEVVIELHAQAREFRIVCGFVDERRPAVETAWKKKAEWWNSEADTLAKDIVWNTIASHPSAFTGLTLGLAKKGFVLPRDAKSANAALRN